MAENSRVSDRRASVVAIVGPTAVGKTAAIAAIAPTIGACEVVVADSMQVYRGLDVGTAKPDAALRGRVPHHLLDIRDPNQQFNAGHFAREAEQTVAAISRRGALPIICGGTGFYVRAYLCGIPHMPPVPPVLHERIARWLQRDGIAPLRRTLLRVDPESAARIDASDGQRHARALEIYFATGKPRSHFPDHRNQRADIDCLLIGLRRERDDLRERINRRVGEMVRGGLAREIDRLLDAGYAPRDPGLRGIGYREFFRYRAPSPATRYAELPTGDAEKIADQIRADSWQYARRQMTFFRGFPNITWINADDYVAIGEQVRRFRERALQ